MLHMSIQNQVIDALMKPEAYDEESGRIEMMQTHISFVFLTKNYVYKVKKAVNLGFLDFTTLEKRRFFCEKELELNKRLCGDMYLEVVPINKSNVVKVKGKGETIEYAVKMKRIPQEKMMTHLLEEKKVDNTLIDRESITDFMRRTASFFKIRAEIGRVRDCHGDIHSGNIFVADRIYIFDAIEFNERFRYSDVASDIAFLAMDLDFKGRTDLSNFFVERYIKYSGDRELTKILPFYKCYRAYVRGKVVSFKLEDPSVSCQEKKRAIREAKAYFQLASAYAKTLGSKN
jgi:aminoglycoside phosphotransferase family enzyme